MKLRPLLIALPALAATLAPASAERVSSRQRQMKFDRQFSRQDTVMREALAPALAKAAKSTLGIVVDGKNVALGTAVHGDGYVVSKSSEIPDGKSLYVDVGNGIRVAAKVTDRLDAYDLALVKLDATGLTPATWNDAAPAPGTFLAAPSPTGTLLAVGVASVPARSLYETPKGFMGVQMKDVDDTVVIESAIKGGPAREAGVEPNDVILGVDGTQVSSRKQLIEHVSGRRPGDEITLKIRRGTEEKELKVRLTDKRDFLSHMAGADDPMTLMSGPLSNHRSGFFNVFQHDLVLQPKDCGGPVVTVEGDIVGLDIARSGRVESLAIPAGDMKALLSNVTSGKFTLPDQTALREELKRAEMAILKAQEARENAERALNRAKMLAETLPKAAPQIAAETAPAPASTVPPATMPVEQPAPGADKKVPTSQP